MEPADPSRILVLDDFLPRYDATEELRQTHPELLNRPGEYKKPGYLGTNVTFEICPRIGDVVNSLPMACRRLGLPVIQKITNLLFIASEHGDPFGECIHCDDTKIFEWGYTFSYHWQGLPGAGGTVFYDDLQGSNELHRVEFRPNRLVAFPARYPHTGYACADQPDNGFRIILAVFAVLDPRRR